MKVVQVIAGCAHESSGTSYFIMNLCRALAKCGVDLTLHSFDACVTPEDGFRSCVTPSRKGLLKSLGWCPKMLQGLRDSVGNYDVVHTNGVWMMSNVYPAWAVKGTKCKLVHSPHGMLSQWALSRSKWKKRIFGWLWQYRALKRADMFHVTSQKEYEEIRALGYRQPVAIIPLGVEVPEGGDRSRSRYEVDGGGESLIEVRGRDTRSTVEDGEGRGRGNRSTVKFGNQSSPVRRVVFFGRLHKVKAVDRLVRAWKLLMKEEEPYHCRPRPLSSTFSSWELVIAGPDNGIRGELEQYIADHKIPRVRFVGEINGPAKYEFLSAADLYVLPSFTENFGVTVAEALACGTPVIVSKGTPWQGVEGEEGGGRGRGNRSTVEFGNPTISRRQLAEKKVDEWLWGVTRESFVSALGKLVEEKTAAGEYRFRRPEERDLALKGAVRFYDEFSRKIIPLSDGRCVYFAPDARSKIRNGNDLSRCWAEYAFHAVSSSGKMISGKDYPERWFNKDKMASIDRIVPILQAEVCKAILLDKQRFKDAVAFLGETADGRKRIQVIARVDYDGVGIHNLAEVTVLLMNARKNTPPLKLLSEVVESVERHQGAGYLPPTFADNIPNPVLSGNPPQINKKEGRGRDTSLRQPQPSTSTLTSASTSSRCGWWVSNDPETLAKTLREAMALSDDERRRMGEAGRDWIRRDFSWEGVGAKMKAAYEWLLDPLSIIKPDFVRH